MSHCIKRGVLASSEDDLPLIFFKLLYLAKMIDITIWGDVTNKGDDDVIQVRWPSEKFLFSKSPAQYFRKHQEVWVSMFFVYCRSYLNQHIFSNRWPPPPIVLGLNDPIYHDLLLTQKGSISKIMMWIWRLQKHFKDS